MTDSRIVHVNTIGRNEKDVDFSRWYKYQQSKMQKNYDFFAVEEFCCLTRAF